MGIFKAVEAVCEQDINLSTIERVHSKICIITPLKFKLASIELSLLPQVMSSQVKSNLFHLIHKVWQYEEQC